MMSARIALLGCAFSLATIANLSISQAVDLEAGKRLAENQCAACHGSNGISNNPLWPNLAGQKEQYLIQSIKAYKNGAREDRLMTPQSKMLSEQDIKNVAAYLSQMKIKVSE